MMRAIKLMYEDIPLRRRLKKSVDWYLIYRWWTSVSDKFFTDDYPWNDTRQGLYVYNSV